MSHFVESMLNVISPIDGFGSFSTQTVCKGFQSMGMTGHLSQSKWHANELEKMCRSAFMVHVQDHAGLLFPALKATWIMPITKPVHFFYGPFTFERVNSETIAMQATADHA